MVTKKSSDQGKFTEAEKAKIIKTVKEEIDKHKKGVKKEDNFTSLSDEELRDKLDRVNSPMIVAQSWSNTTPGGTFTYNVTINNPDPITRSNLYAHVFVGTGNSISNTGDFLLNVDARFPRLTQPAFFGLSLAPGASSTLSFSIKVPSTIELGNYVGNTALVMIDYHDIGTYFDRGAFPFKVS
ncbi:MAG: hypothetical protein QOH25_208 [Acidobacteriota bacterium]|jgi:hypothetical protein|nr:hypothetical protein [Acidobacteriota bacterium]